MQTTKPASLAHQAQARAQQAHAAARGDRRSAAVAHNYLQARAALVQVGANFKATARGHGVRHCSQPAGWLRTVLALLGL